jgi:hypothetical protein
MRDARRVRGQLCGEEGSGFMASGGRQTLPLQVVGPALASSERTEEMWQLTRCGTFLPLAA